MLNVEIFKSYEGRAKDGCPTIRGAVK